MKKIFILLFVLINTALMAQTKIIYVGDPMCSWCYGIAPEYTKLLERFEGEIDFELVMGGLRPYNTQKMPELKDFLKEHWHEVNERSGQEFTYGILDNENITYDTEPPSRATVVVRNIDASKEIEFFKKAQVLFYKENKNMHLAESYFDLLDEMKIDKEVFARMFASDEMKEKIKEDFMRASALNANSFPTILLEHNGQFYAVAKGYSTAEKMIGRIEKVLH